MENEHFYMEGEVWLYGQHILVATTFVLQCMHFTWINDTILQSIRAAHTLQHGLKIFVGYLW